MVPWATVQDVERLVAEHRAAVRALAHSVVGNASDAEDIAQETLLTVVEQRRSIDAARNPRAWMLKIALNKARDFLRRKKVRSEPLAPASPPTTDADVERVRRVFREAPPRYRTILHLAYFEEMAYQEIADVTGLSLGAVKMAILRGRRWMRSRLDELR